MINEKIKKQALELSDQERAELAHMLIDSLHPEKEFESEEAWSEEVKKLLEFDYPHPKDVALRQIHGCATAISLHCFRQSQKNITTC